MVDGRTRTQWVLTGVWKDISGLVSDLLGLVTEQGSVVAAIVRVALQQQDGKNDYQPNPTFIRYNKQNQTFRILQ